MKVRLGLLVMCLATVGLSAAEGPDVPVAERAKGAQRVVVAKATDSWSSFEVNKYGDRLIVSHVTFDVEETIKGRPVAQVVVDVEGGTVNGLTLKVSDMPAFERGHRAVLFLDEASTGKLQLHRRGLGSLRLNERNQVADTDVPLTTIRSQIRQAIDSK